jgi:hypothetical protein
MFMDLWDFQDLQEWAESALLLQSASVSSLGTSYDLISGVWLRVLASVRSAGIVIKATITPSLS